MWQSRLEEVLSAPFELIHLKPDSEQRSGGRYLRLDGGVLGLGSQIAFGAEAFVFELIDLAAGIRKGVAKICRYPPGSKQYREWAVPFRFEVNPHSAKPDVEMYPARLIEVPGGLIKIQEYISNTPETDWSTMTPAYPIMIAYRNEGREKALDKALQMTELHGPRGILLELQGRMWAEMENWENARASLERAMTAYRTESREGLLRTGLALADVHRSFYESNNWHDADHVTTLDLPDGPQLSQVLFSDPKAGALDDMLQDRSLYVLFEILAVEPCFIPALFELAEEFSTSPVAGMSVLRILDAIERIDPNREDVRAFRQSYEAASQGSAGQIGSAPVNPESQQAGSSLNPEPDAASQLTAPPDLSSTMKRFDEFYQPEPAEGQVAAARLASAWANLRQGRIEEAERAAREAIKLDPDNVEPYLALSGVLYAKGEKEAALETLEAAARELSANAEIYEVLGNFYLDQGRSNDALLAYLRALVSHPPERWRIELGIGKAHAKLGQTEAALRYMRNAYGAAPGDADAALSLVFELRRTETEANRLEAAKIVETSLEQHPDNVGLLVSHAKLLCHKNDLEEAIPFLERAIGLRPDHYIAKDLLAAIREALRKD